MGADGAGTLQPLYVVFTYDFFSTLDRVVLMTTVITRTFANSVAIGVHFSKHHGHLCTTALVTRHEKNL